MWIRIRGIFETVKAKYSQKPVCLCFIVYVKRKGGVKCHDQVLTEHRRESSVSVSCRTFFFIAVNYWSVHLAVNNGIERSDGRTDGRTGGSNRHTRSNTPGH